MPGDSSFISLPLVPAAHDRVVCTKQLLCGLAWWPGMDEQVTHLVGDCTYCQSSNKVSHNKARQALLQSVDIPPCPWTQLGLDIVGLINNAPPSQHYIIVLMNHTSKWPEISTVIVSSVDSSDVIISWTRFGPVMDSWKS